MKLFNIVTPEKVYFGQKDIQQTVVIKQTVKDFCVDTHVVVGETTREPDGLAMSSRNAYEWQRLAICGVKEPETSSWGQQTS
jgi:pantoate--beta-alanine ligase